MQIRRFYKLKQCWFKVLLLSQKEKKIRSLMIHGQRAQMRCGAELAANLRKKKYRESARTFESANCYYLCYLKVHNPIPLPTDQGQKSGIWVIYHRAHTKVNFTFSAGGVVWKGG